MKKLPNNYGSVSKLSGKRRRPYVVRKTNARGECSIIGYASTREEGLEMLAAYNANPWDVDKSKITLQELFELWTEKKMPKLGKSNRASLKTAFRHCASLGDIPYKQIKAYQMQECIDNCGCGYSTQGAIKNLWGHLDKFALELDVSTSRYADLLTSDPIPPTSRIPFTKEEIKILWDNKNIEWVDTILIFIYSGWRISELLSLRSEDIDLTAGTMKGGVKTRAGKDRIVPIHHKINGFIETRLAKCDSFLLSTSGKRLNEKTYRNIWSDIMDKLQMDHKPHDTRHTFESLLDAAGGNRRCIDLLMGHTSKDTGNRVYNHKTIDELKETVELISI